MLYRLLEYLHLYDFAAQKLGFKVWTYCYTTFVQNGKSQKLLSPQLDNSGENWMKKFLIVQLIWWHWFELGILVSKKHYFEQAFRVRHLLQSPPKSGLVFSKADQNKEEKDAGIGMDGLIPQVDMLDSKSLHGGWPCFGIFHAASQLRPPSLSKAKVAAKLPIFSTQAGRQKSLVDPITLLVFTLWKTNPIQKWKFQIFICGTKYSVDVFLLHLDFSFYIHILKIL